MNLLKIINACDIALKEMKEIQEYNKKPLVDAMDKLNATFIQFKKDMI